MLESAIHYCQVAGVSILGANAGGALVLTIPGAAYILTHGGTRAALELAPETAASGEPHAASEARQHAASEARQHAASEARQHAASEARQLAQTAE